MMRSLAQVASPMLGQSIVILNKSGASGIIGVSYVSDPHLMATRWRVSSMAL
jgi:tripartite-type tricarboxylate transporter receptor subunit TctC